MSGVEAQRSRRTFFNSLIDRFFTELTGADVNDRNIVIFLLAIIATFVVGVILYLLESVLLPLVVATFLSYLFKPLVIFLKRKRIPIVISLIVVFVSIASVCLGLSLVIYSSVDSFIAEAPKYQDRINSMVVGAQNFVTDMASRFNIPSHQLDWSAFLDVSSVTSILSTSLGSTLTFLTNTVLVLLYMFFILAASGDFAEKVRHAFIKSHSEKIGGVISRIDSQVRQYLLTKTLISLATGGLTALVLWAFGVDFALFWGFLAFLLNYIPNVGSLLAEIFPVILAFLQFEGIVTPLIILILLVGMQTTMGNVVEPKVMAFSLNLSPLVVLVALIFWGWLWGIVGMIIAVPMTAILKIIFENIEELSSLAKLMGGPIVTKGESATVKAAG